MEFEFECGCGEVVIDFTRGTSPESSSNVVCDDCGARYAITITQIGTSDGEPSPGHGGSEPALR
jgi:transcription elongation factor Elf1